MSYHNPMFQLLITHMITKSDGGKKNLFSWQAGVAVAPMERRQKFALFLSGAGLVLQKSECGAFLGSSQLIICNVGQYSGLCKSEARRGPKQKNRNCI